MATSRGYNWVLFALAMAAACGSDGREGEPDARAMDGAVVGDAAPPRMDATLLDGAVSDARVALPDGSPFPVNLQGQVLCGTSPCACSDGLDDDQDGLIDLADPECVSSWDDDESSFATGISGDNRDTACQDCFFDGNSGSGDDGCRIATSCLTNANDSSSGRGSCDTCTASDKCRTTCQAYTPNGCDCFGCCTVQLGSNVTKNVLLAPGCNIDGADTSGCTECVPSTSCNNRCGECELCPGKTLADLPASCGNATPDAGTPTPSCDDGQQVCSGSGTCPAGQLCQFGCCQLSPILI